MIEILRNIRTRIEGVLLARARADARRRLLSMSDRNLEDIGISRKLLEQGVAAWPWRESELAVRAAERSSELGRARAIRELRAYSDRELNQLGLSRVGIVEAVTHGRPGIDYDDPRAA